MPALKITYDNTSGLTADTVQAALDELVVNLGSSDSAILALSGRLDTLEGTGEGSVADDIAKYAVKLTKIPNGATAVYSQDAWETADGWTNIVGGATATVSGGAITVPATGIRKILAGFSAQTFIAKVTATTSGTLRVGTATVYTSITVLAGTGVVMGQIPIASGDIDITNLACTLDWIWIGDYSYLPNSLSTEASRIANQLGDTTGVGTKASGTITSNGTNVSDGDTVTIAGKVYTFKTILGTTEGNVLIGGTAAESLDNLKLAINSTGVTAEQYCATFHPLVEATTNTDTMQTLVARSVGILGNSITLAKSASTLTLSGPTLTGGTDDVGEKMRTQIASLNRQWITPTLVNSWVAVGGFGQVRYKKSAIGETIIQGVIEGGAPSVIFTLPSGYRPAYDLRFPSAGYGGTSMAGYLSVTTAGNVTMSGSFTNPITLSAIRFPAEA